MKIEDTKEESELFNDLSEDIDDEKEEHKKDEQEREEGTLERELNQIDLLSMKTKEPMQITKCPHTHRRHYAKVR